MPQSRGYLWAWRILRAILSLLRVLQTGTPDETIPGEQTQMRTSQISTRGIVSMWESLKGKHPKREDDSCTLGKSWPSVPMSWGLWSEPATSFSSVLYGNSVKQVPRSWPHKVGTVTQNREQERRIPEQVTPIFTLAWCTNIGNTNWVIFVNAYIIIFLKSLDNQKESKS